MILKRWVFILLISFSSFGFAVDLELTQGMNKALPIALVPFHISKSLSQSIIYDVIRDDLTNSGQFRFLQYNHDKHHPANSIQTNYKYWTKIGANNLIVGDVVEKEEGKISVSFQLLDPHSVSHIILGREYTISPDNQRALAHRQAIL